MAVVSSAGSSGVGEIEEAPAVEEEKVYVAVGQEFKAWKANLSWVLRCTSREAKIVITHVHRPAQMINMLGGRFPASSLQPQQVNAYRQIERDKMNKSLDEYIALCSQLKVRAEKLVIEMDNVGKGLVELIARYGIMKLVMGAAADKHYTKKMKAPKSKTAITVKEEADPSCKIWFVCKGSLICTREASLDASGLSQSPTASSSSISGQSEQLRSLSLCQGQSGLINRHMNPVPRSRSNNYGSPDGELLAVASPLGPVRTLTLHSRLSTEGSSIDPWEGISRRNSQSSDPSSWSASDELLSNSGSFSLPKDEESEIGSVRLPSVHESDQILQFSTPHHELEDLGLDADVYTKLQQALTEAENLKSEAYEESRRRWKTEKELVVVLQKAKASEDFHTKEVKQRKEIEETLAREKLEVQKLKNQQDEINAELRKANEQRSAFELQIADSDCIAKDLEEKLSAARYLLHSLQAENEVLQRERDNAVKEAEDLRQRGEQLITGNHEELNVEFSYSDLEQATQNFSDSLKIGEGGFGRVYKGFLRNTAVAIKMLHPGSLQGRSEFHQEAAVLSKVRHPNLVTLIGASSESWALVYEFLPNGSLEDRLTCMNNTPPLTWQVRTRIIAEICSALIFLHSNKPHPVVHGDLKPDNILLDANFVSKLGDFGICRLIIQSSTTTATLYRHTHPKGTFAYMDPEFLTTGELTPQSDVYSFGIIILRLLTGKPALAIGREVQDALDKGSLHDMIDPSAGDWPFVQTKQLAHLGVRCCKMSRKSRPDLMGEAWRVIEPMTKAASLSLSPSSFGSFSSDSNHIPSYFICPIFQEIMKDPVIAADGFTYEAEAIRGWIDSGHNTSPMTNIKLPHGELIPNRALRSAILEWQQQQQL
ncbi:U-box domain-containing protein 33 [Cocos nucifera]|uniref:RING-type E3 ubiquitin transferase n=1 Tax=Cocos nucifera TaxID=13894 RepID=A0A8K0N4S4_COCNU|nr:U-box domain-containing protein 33 [Cocos nucifera]